MPEAHEHPFVQRFLAAIDERLLASPPESEDAAYDIVSQVVDGQTAEEILREYPAILDRQVNLGPWLEDPRPRLSPRAAIETALWEIVVERTQAGCRWPRA